MSCIKEAMLCSELTIVRLELCRNFLVPHKFAFHVLVRFMSQVILFFGVVNEFMQPRRAVLKTFTKSFGEQRWWSTFLGKLWNYNLKVFNGKRDSAIREIFRIASQGQTSGWLLLFHALCKTCYFFQTTKWSVFVLIACFDEN